VKKPTPYGKRMRMERLKREIIALEMAEKLGVTPSFLSSVELGRKKVPQAWMDKLTEYLSLSETEQKQLEILIARSNAIVSQSTNEQVPKNTIYAPKSKDLGGSDRPE